MSDNSFSNLSSDEPAVFATAAAAAAAAVVNLALALASAAGSVSTVLRPWMRASSASSAEESGGSTDSDPNNGSPGIDSATAGFGPRFVSFADCAWLAWDWDWDGGSTSIGAAVAPDDAATSTRRSHSRFRSSLRREVRGTVVPSTMRLLSLALSIRLGFDPTSFLAFAFQELVSVRERGGGS